MQNITLKALRVNANMTQEEVAKELGISTKTVWNYENGVTMPDVDMIKKFEKLYNIDYSFIKFTV